MKAILIFTVVFIVGEGVTPVNIEEGQPNPNYKKITPIPIIFISDFSRGNQSRGGGVCCERGKSYKKPY